jgi:hypothetical protein
MSRTDAKPVDEGPEVLVALEAPGALGTLTAFEALEPASAVVATASARTTVMPTAVRR